MRAIRVFILLTAIAGLVNAQTPTDNATPGMILGVIVDAQTAQPISGARVSVRQRRTVTDRAGAFRLEQVPPGKYVLNVEADDFRVAGVLPTVDVAGGQIVEGVRVSMQGTSTISGRAFDENGEPMPNATAELLTWRETSTRSWMLRPLRTQNSVTNDRGEYRITGLDPGDYFIRINPFTSDRSRYPATFYPNTTNSADAAKITISGAGEMSGIDVRLAPNGVRVRGRFVTPDNRAGPVRIEVVRRDVAVPVEPVSIEGTRDSFDIAGIPPGSYYLYAISRLTPILNSPIPNLEWARIPIEVGAEDLDELVFPITASGSIKGRVSIAAPIVDVDAYDLSKIELTLSSASDSPEFQLPVLANPSGQFELPGVPEGRMFVRQSSLGDGWFVSAVRLNGEDVLRSGFSVAPGKEAVLDIEISNAGGVISGVITDREGKPIPTARYVLLPDSSRRANPASTQTGVAREKGELQIDSLPPGEYTIIGFPDEDEFTPVFLRNPQLIPEYERFGQPVLVDAGQTTQTTVAVAPVRK